ncbi:MAG: alpha/beta hydrolase, partial [Pseudomonadota bacterium]
MIAPPKPPQSHLQYASLQARDGIRLLDADIRLAFREFGEASPDKPSILLLHGTPVASSAMVGLATRLSARHHVLVPDLPGFGGSAQPLEDYSSLTHGLYMADWLRQRGRHPVHVIAYSQGGAAAIKLTADYPSLTQSLTLIATIGVQELELFGNYTMNHAVYAGQLTLLRGAQWLLPHFGALDDIILGTGYARNLTDTDQRPLRDMLTRVQAPTIIVHGRDDGLVPFAAAEEHHRLIAQSTLTSFDGGHELAYAKPGVL